MKEFRRVVDDLVESEGDEIAKHDLDKGAASGKSHANSDAGDRGFADRRRQDPLRESRGKSLADLEGAAVGVGNIFAEEDRAGVVLEPVTVEFVELLSAASAARGFASTPLDRAVRPRQLVDAIVVEREPRFPHCSRDVG